MKGTVNRKRRAANAKKMQRQQYTSTELAKAIVQAIFTIFARRANYDSNVESHG